MEYIKLQDYAKNMGIKKGDIVFISSDGKTMMWDAHINKESSDLNLFIDGVIDAVGSEGTVIFPTYNWDFCGGKKFDYASTPCKTGVLGTLALKRGDFKRTFHPIYSFAVYGRLQSEFLKMNNKEAFGLDSPFAFFRDYNVKNYIIDVNLESCFTFVHFVEEQSGVVKHRYIKDFTAGYIDQNGNESMRTYSMFVRNLDLDVKTTIDPIESELVASGAERQFMINSSEIKEILLGEAFPVLLKDITENRSRKLCTFIGQ